MKNEVDPLDGLFRKITLLVQLLASYFVFAPVGNALPDIARSRDVAIQPGKTQLPPKSL